MDKTDKIPVFAIILPVYNEENNIRQCLDSIVRQTFEDWVCYICNDCSTDNSVSICAEYAQQDSRFVIINSKYAKYTETGKIDMVNKDMSGISKMLNLGIAVSESKYVLRMDADDEMLPYRLQLTYDWMESHADCDIAGFPVIYKGQTYNLSSMTGTADGECTFGCMSRNVKPYHPTVCMRRASVLEKTTIMYQQPYDGCEDAFLWFHAKARGCKIMLADTEPVIVYKGGRQTKKATYLFERLTRVYRYSIEKEQDPSAKLTHWDPSRKMTVVIGFKNENIELEKTIVSLLLSDDDINIVLVDDCSNDNYDYNGVAETFGCFYYKSDKPLGCAAARQEGVKHVNTPYFILMDAHMRINVNQENWTRRFITELDKGDDKIVQCNTVIMKSNAEEDSHFRSYVNEDCLAQPEGAACIGAMYNHKHEGRDWASDWCYRYLDEEATDIRQTAHAGTIVQCVSLMGADYAMSVRWWNKIGGLDGLAGWGHDEPLLSIKTYLMGGEILTYPKYGIGHLYRHKPTYGNLETAVAQANLLFIQYLVSHAESKYETDDGLFEMYKSQMRQHVQPDVYEMAIGLFNKNKEKYDKIKKYVWENATRKLSDIYKLEERLK